MSFMKMRSIPILCLGLMILALYSCAPAAKNKPAFHLPGLKTIGILPITYDEACKPPLRWDIKGKDLSAMIIYQTRNMLEKKGYTIIVIEDTAEAGKAQVHGLLQVHVTSHSGIAFREYAVQGPPFLSMRVVAGARLMEPGRREELWHTSANASGMPSPNFTTALNSTLHSLARKLVGDWPQLSSAN